MLDKKVLVIGSGGREYAFAWKLSNDSEVAEVYCAPGNGGTELFCKNLNLDINNHREVLDAINELEIDITLIGPEAPLANGIVDYLEFRGVKVFGPDKYGAQLESSKLFARDLMNECRVPQPKYQRCTSIKDAIAIKDSWGLPLVIKADGLAAGKGVIICEDDNSFDQAMEVMFRDPKFGNASRSVSVEECLIGEELSIFAVCNGEDYRILNTAQDYKRIYDGDQGPNTGGMGAYSPTPLSTNKIISKTEDRIIKPVLSTMKDRGHPYNGFLYIGIMIVNGNPYVIEFNVRMGDPETQVVIPLLDSSFYNLLNDCLSGNLATTEVVISNRTAVAVVLAADGYPNNYKKGMEITGVDSIKEGFIFHAGTKLDKGALVSSGGRVLNAVGFGENLSSAIENTYQIIDKIDFSDKYYRKDIGQKGLTYK